MTILNSIQTAQLTLFGSIVIGIGVLCFLVAVGGAAVEKRIIVNIAMLALLMDVLFCLTSTLIFKVPFIEPTGHYQYEVTIEDIEAVRGYRIIDQRGSIYTVEELPEDNQPARQDMEK